MIDFVVFSGSMYGFQETQAEYQKSAIDHPDHEEIEAEMILQMTPLRMLLPAPPYWCQCGCQGTEGM